MNISPITSSLIAPTGFFATASARPVAYLINTPVATSASVVDISDPGKLLSATSIFDNGILRPDASGQSSFDTAVTTAQLFADVFNSFLQSASDNLQYPASGSLGSVFLQVLNAQDAAAPVDGKSVVARLAEAGINYQAPSVLNDTARMTIDLKSLQSAYSNDPSGTSALLAQAIQSIGPLASTALNGVLATTATTTTLLTAATTTASALLSAADTPTTAESIPALVATEQLTASESLTAAAQLTAPALPGTVPELPTAIAQSTAATPLAATTTAVAAEPPIATAAPTAKTVSAPALAAAPTAAPVVAEAGATPSNYVNPIIVAIDPATAAAIAAYHLVDGILDTGMPHAEGSSPAAYTYSEIWAVAKIRPVKLDLHV